MTLGEVLGGAGGDVDPTAAAVSVAGAWQPVATEYVRLLVTG